MTDVLTRTGWLKVRWGEKAGRGGEAVHNIQGVQ